MGDLSDFQRGVRFSGAFVSKTANLSGVSRAGYDGLQNSCEDIIS
jgi:hypothetical protein